MSGMAVLPVTESRPEAAGIGEHGGADYLMLRDFLASINAGAPVTVDIRAALRMTLPGPVRPRIGRKRGRSGSDPLSVGPGRNESRIEPVNHSFEVL